MGFLVQVYALTGIVHVIMDMDVLIKVVARMVEVA